MSDFFSGFWTFFISLGTLGGIFWLVYLLKVNSKTKAPPPGEEVKSTGHAWDGIEELNNPLPFWWVAMFYVTIVFALAYLVLYPGLGTVKGVLGWTSVNEHTEEVKSADKEFGPLFEKYAQTPIEELAKDKKALLTGGRIFASNCSICHGSDARGARGFPNLADNDWLYGNSPDQIKTSILSGRKGNMPGWQATLGDQGVKEVTSYVLSLSNRDAPAEEVEAGKKHYTAMCAGCHLPTGQGMHALGAPNLTDDIWLFGASRGYIEQSIAEGRKGEMPAHDQLLDESKIHVLTAYVYSLSQQKQ